MCKASELTENTCFLKGIKSEITRLISLVKKGRYMHKATIAQARHLISFL